MLSYGKIIVPAKLECGWCSGKIQDPGTGRPLESSMMKVPSCERILYIHLFSRSVYIDPSILHYRVSTGNTWTCNHWHYRYLYACYHE